MYKIKSILFIIIHTHLIIYQYKIVASFLTCLTMCHNIKKQKNTQKQNKLKINNNKIYIYRYKYKIIIKNILDHRIAVYTNLLIRNEYW